MRMPTFDGAPESGTLSKHMLLPHQLIQRPRPHPDGQWRISSFRASRLAGCLLTLKQAVGHFR
jgi:hypothetical protein